MSGLIFLGAGGVAAVAADTARLTGFEIAGFLDDNTARHGSDFCGAPVLGGFERLPELKRRGYTHAIIAFSAGAARLKLAREVLEAGFILPTLTHPSAIIARDVAIGPGSIIMAGVIVNSGTRLEANVILNTACSVDHDGCIGEAVHIAPGARLSGRVTVGRTSWIGVGSVVKEGTRIGCGTLIGAGSLVLKEIPDGVVAYGSPARVIRPYVTPGSQS